MVLVEHWAEQQSKRLLNININQMQFNAVSNKNGIIQNFELKTNIGLGNVSGVPAALAEATTSANHWLHIAHHWIKMVQGEHRYDDANHGNFDIEEFSFADDQQDYGLSTNGEKDNLAIRKVRVRDAVDTDKYTVLDFCYEKDIPEATFEADKDTPTKYWLSGGSIIFDCPVDVAKVDKYELTYDRGAHLFTTADTTAEPGFDVALHDIVYLGMSMDWSADKNPSVYNACQAKIFGVNGLKQMLEEIYSSRTPQAIPFVGRKKVSWN